MWADEQFAFLELSRRPGHAGDEEECVQPQAQHRSWSKVKAHFAAVCIEKEKKRLRHLCSGVVYGGQVCETLPPWASMHT